MVKEAVFALVGLVVLGILVRANARRVIHLPRRVLRSPGDGLLIFGITFLFGGCAEARADSSVEVSGGTGFGALVVGVTSARFAVSPSISVASSGS